MPKNKFTDLNNHLFEALERLNDEDIKGEALQEEIQRARAITGIASQIVAGAGLIVRAEELRLNYQGDKVNLPLLLEGKSE